MKVTGLDGKNYTWKLQGHVPLCNDSRPRSVLHIEVRLLLQSLYPTDRILEEVPLPGSGGLVVDFYLPHHNLIVEVHGEQHYKFIPFFHGDFLGFIASRRRDMEKEHWCLLNNIDLIILSFTENSGEWTKRLCSRTVEKS